MTIEHTQSAQNGEVVKAENVGALQAEKQDHFRRPHTDTLEGGECADGVGIAHVCHGINFKRAALHLCGKVGDILRFSECHAERLQLRHARRKDVGVHSAERVLHPLPNRCLRLTGQIQNGILRDPAADDGIVGHDDDGNDERQNTEEFAFGMHLRIGADGAFSGAAASARMAPLKP